jgi:Conjugative transposon protein TcpC
MTAEGEGLGRVVTLTRPAWRVALAARAPRLVAGVLAGVLIVAGLRTVVAGPPDAARVSVPAAATDLAAEGFAQGFARAYLSWDPGHPEQRERELARFVSSELDPGAGVEPSRVPQQVDSTTVVGSRPLGRGRRTVTVAARAGGRSWHLAVAVIRDARGYLAIGGYPALVGPPPPPTRRAPVEQDAVEDRALVSVAERAVRNYLAGARTNLAADLDAGAVVSLPDRPATVRSVDEVSHAGRGRVAVVLSASVGGARLTLRYELAVVRRGRWYVREIETDPRNQPAGARR